MTTEQEETYCIAVFPFLKTSGPVTIGHHIFRTTHDIQTLPSGHAEDVRRVSRMLYLQDDLRIDSATYCIVRNLNLDQSQSVQDLRNIQALVAYVYAFPRHEFGDLFLSAEHSSMAIFSPSRFFPALARPEHNVIATEDRPNLIADDRGEVLGYRGLYNFRHHFWVAERSRLYGPKPNMVLNIAQDLATDLDRASCARPDYGLLRRLLAGPVNDAYIRVFTAVQSFNAANDAANEEPAAIVYLSVAFEALLRVPSDHKSDRLIDAISMLLGRIPRLDIWARQFYDVRSRILHEGTADQLRFVATDSPQAHGGLVYQSLLSYGRRVFQLCLGAILVGIDLAEGANLAEQLVTNEERFEKICKILGESGVDPSESLRLIGPIVQAASQYRYVGEPGLRIEPMIGAASLTSKALLQTSPKMTPQAVQALEQLAAAQRTSDHIPQLTALKNVDTQLKQSSFGGDQPAETAGVDLLHLVWQYVGLHYEWIVRKSPDEIKPASD